MSDWVCPISVVFLFVVLGALSLGGETNLKRPPRSRKMSETLSEQVLRVIADFEWIGTQRRLGEMWAMDIAALEAERDELRARADSYHEGMVNRTKIIGQLEAKLEAMERLPNLVPNTWLDPLLSGPDAVWRSPPAEVEKLLRAVKSRMTDFIAAQQEQE